MTDKNDMNAWAEAIATGMYVAHWASVRPHAPALVGAQSQLSFGVDFVDGLPRFDNGKIYKHALRERYRKRAR